MGQPVGYFLQHASCECFTHGQFYDYIFAKNGVFIQAKNSLITARVPVSVCTLRGLLGTFPEIVLNHGKIPGVFFELAFNTALTRKEKEVYFAVTWKDDGKYHLYMTDQDGKTGKVDYHTMPDTIMDIHSHGRIPAHFSGQDDRDEQGLRLSCTIGNLDDKPMVAVRIGVYGYFMDLPWGDVFDGVLTGAVDKYDYVEEVEPIELQSVSPDTQDNCSRSWWNRILGH